MLGCRSAKRQAYIHLGLEHLTRTPASHDTDVLVLIAPDCWLGQACRQSLWYYTVDFTSREYQATKRRASEAKSVVVRPIDKKRWDREPENLARRLQRNLRRRVGVSPPEQR